MYGIRVTVHVTNVMEKPVIDNLEEQIREFASKLSDNLIEVSYTFWLP